MPYKSDAQRRFMHAKHPDIAAKWDQEIRSKKKKVTKRMDPDKRLKAQKKLSAATSIVGGTLGLGGLTALALKKPVTATKLNIGAGGLGGVGAYNYASIQNQEAKKKPPRQNVYVVRNKKQIKSIKSGLEPVKKGLDVMDFGLSDVRQGESVHIISKRQEVEKGWSEDHPKTRLQNIALHEKRKGGGVYQHDPDTVHQRYKGKSLILRRPKYQVVGMPSHKAREGSQYVAAVGPNYRVGRGDALKLQEAYKNKSKTVTSGAGGKFKNKVEKAYNPEQKRQRRLENTATALSVGSGASGAAAVPFAMKAAGLGKHKGLRAKSLPAYKSGLKNAGKAGGLGLTAVGLAVGSDRVRSYRSGKGGSYRQLHRGS